jgi:hypothetical protein
MMAFFIVKNGTEFVVVGAEGFTPDGALSSAPVEWHGLPGGIIEPDGDAFMINDKKLAEYHATLAAEKARAEAIALESKRIRTEAERNVRDRSKRKGDRAVRIMELAKESDSELLKLIVDQLLDD